MERNKLENMAKVILEKVCGTDEIFEDYDLDLVEEGFIDSFSVLSIILEIEKSTGIRLQPTDINKNEIKTINLFIDYLDTLNIK